MINNIENVSAMYLVKTIYSTILSILYTFLPLPLSVHAAAAYADQRVHGGHPSFLLALRPNFERPEGRFCRMFWKIPCPPR